MKEGEGDDQGAINLYLKAGLPAKAARLAMSRPNITNNGDAVSRITASLVKAEYYEQVAGGLILDGVLLSDLEKNVITPGWKKCMSTPSDRCCYNP